MTDFIEFFIVTYTRASQAHRTNVMFVQPESLHKDSPAMSCAGEPKISASELSKSLKNVGSQIQEV